jgi:UDP-N-acetylglucosamine transferase subunit ALG13
LIFVTLGTHEQPFERSIDMLADAAIDDELVVQHGHTPARSDLPNSRWLSFTTYEELAELVRGSEAVVSHCGVGTILTALRLGKIPIVVPRLRKHGEHVDDHQLQIAREFGRRGLVRPCFDAAGLASALEGSRRLRPAPLATNEGLRAAVVAAAAPRSCSCGETGWAVRLDRTSYQPPGKATMLRVEPCGCGGLPSAERRSRVQRLLTPLTKP